ncbi:MAG: hypothetical protein FWH08_02180 [Oscillospiraceae bacterium]|nr:hypothetical protein [Oscillospiraceae bacterium]
MKKSLVLLLVLCLSVTLFAGCDSSLKTDIVGKWETNIDIGQPGTVFVVTYEYKADGTIDIGYVLTADGRNVTGTGNGEYKISGSNIKSTIRLLGDSYSQDGKVEISGDNLTLVSEVETMVFKRVS